MGCINGLPWKEGGEALDDKRMTSTLAALVYNAQEISEGKLLDSGAQKKVRAKEINVGIPKTKEKSSPMKVRKKAGTPASRKQVKETPKGRKCPLMMGMVMISRVQV